MSKHIEVIDGLPVAVDNAKWAADPKKEIARIRALRESQRLDPWPDAIVYPDYHTLTGEKP